MRSKNAIISSAVGIINVFVRLIISLVMRKVFLNYFGPEYLGVYFIFDSIFGVLVALDCGISSSVFLKIYKPLEDGDTKKISSVFNLVKLVYTIRAICVFIFGFVIYFFLPNLISESTLEIGFIKKCYIVYAICNSINYLFIFYQFFLESVQKRYIVTTIELPLYFIEIVLQLIAIVVAKNYILYLFVTTSIIVCVNFGCMMVTYHKYPYLKKSRNIDAEDKKGFLSLLGMAFHSLSSVLSKYTDTFLTTIFAGVVQTGLYGNYKTLNTTIMNFVNQITASTKDPFRAIISQGNKDDIHRNLRNLNFLMYWIGCFCCVCLSTLSSKFIILWLGDEYVLSNSVVVTTSIALYLSLQNYFIVDAYYTTYSYMKDKKSPIIEIITNLVLSVLLGYKFGITGIMIGTITYYIIQTILRAIRLYNKTLDKDKLRILFRILFKYLFITVFLTLSLNYLLMNIFVLHNKYLDLLFAFFVSVTIPNVINYLIFRKTVEFNYFHEVLKRITNR